MPDADRPRRWRTMSDYVTHHLKQHDDLDEKARVDQAKVYIDQYKELRDRELADAGEPAIETEDES
jgi:hypothetical protein